METIYQYIQTIIANACVAEFKIDKADVDQTNFVVEKPKDDANGDLSTNICLILSKVLNDNPISIAEKLSQKLSTNEEFNKFWSASKRVSSIPYTFGPCYKKQTGRNCKMAVVS